MEKLFDISDFENGIITKDGVEYVKVLRYNDKGFSCTSKHDWEFIDREDNCELEVPHGCFVFLRFIDTEALDSVRAIFSKYSVSYIPTAWDVFARNGVSEEDSDRYLDGASRNAFIKVPVTEVLERIYKHEIKPPAVASSEDEPIKADGIKYNSLASFLACEVILTAQQINYLNENHLVVTLPYSELVTT